MAPRRRALPMLVAAVLTGALGFALVFLTLQGFIEPMLGWPLAVVLYLVAIAVTVMLVRFAARTLPAKDSTDGPSSE